MTRRRQDKFNLHLLKRFKTIFESNLSVTNKTFIKLGYTFT